jgi:DNA-directed RNA polymerase subunit RPC12/RpoP
MGKGERIILDRTIVCPECGIDIQVKAVRRVIVPATQSTFEIDVTVEKAGVQSKLD